MKSIRSMNPRYMNADDFLKPEVSLPAVYLVFLFSAFVAFRIRVVRENLSAFADPSVLSFVLSLGAVSLIICFIRIGKKIQIYYASRISRTCRSTPHFFLYLILTLIFSVTSLALYLTFPMPGVLIFGIAGGYAFLVWQISKRLEDTGLLTAGAVGIAVVFAFATLVRGIPIMDAVSRQDVAVTPARALFHGFAIFASTLLIAFYGKKRGIPVILFLALLGIASGFKSDAIAILVSAGIAGLLLKRVSLKEVCGILIVVVFILTAVSTHIANISYDTWKIPPVYYMFYRAGFTFSVFNEIVELSFPNGYLYGEAILSTTQEIMSTRVLDYDTPHIITSTLIGPGMLDFGVWGIVATAAFIGVYLGFMDGFRRTRFETCLFAIALTHTFILIEVGLQLSSIILYLSLLYLFLSGGVPEGGAPERLPTEVKP